MRYNFDFNSIKNFAVTVIFGVISLTTLNYITGIIAFLVGVTSLIINIKKLFKK